MKEVRPDPLPKCFCPEMRYPNSLTPSGSHTLAVRAVSPPEPGSLTMVPHQHPLWTLSNTSLRCLIQPAVNGSGTVGSRHEDSTRWCMALARVMEGSPPAKVLNMEQIGRADCSRVSQVPPRSVGTAISGTPTCASRA